MVAQVEEVAWDAKYHAERLHELARNAAKEDGLSKAEADRLAQEQAEIKRVAEKRGSTAAAASTASAGACRSR